MGDKIFRADRSATGKKPWISDKVLTLFCNQCRTSSWSEKQLDETAFQVTPAGGCKMWWTQKVAEDNETDRGSGSKVSWELLK